MDPRTFRDRTMARLWLGLAALSCLFVGVVVANAQAPVITDPGDLKILSVNTVFSPLDPDARWTSMAPMPRGRAGFAIAVADRKIYAIGGAIINDCVITSAVEAYDPVADLWITGLAPIPGPNRWRPSGGTLDNTVYVIGGAESFHGCPGEAFDIVQAYDPATDRWTTKPSMPTARTQVGVGVDSVNRLLYAVGGATGRPDFEVLTAVEVFDPTGGDNGEGSWTKKQDLNIARALPAVAAVNGKIYAVGGQSPDSGVIDTVEEFDPATNKWTIQKSRMPHPRLNPGAAVLDGKIYIVGGRTDVLLSSVDVYDPALDLWTTGLPLPTARRGLGAAVVDNNLYAIGGDALVTTVDRQFAYQITGTENPTSYDAFPLPDGLSIDHERGIISGTPITADDAFDLTFEITNSSGSDSRNVSFYIAPPPAEELSSIVSSTCVTGRAGQPFAFQVLTNNASSDARLMATGLPYHEGAGPEITIDPGTGLISGTVPPTFDGSAESFGVGLNLDDGSSAQSYLQMTFVSDPLFPVITSSSNATLVLNQFFSHTITADAPVTSTNYLGLDGVLGGSLPGGLSFDGATGTIFGIYRGDLASKPPTGQGAHDNPVARRPDAIETIKKEPPPRIQTLVTQDEVGTGTAPLNFFISLHDFEMEALSTVASRGATYGIFTNDPLTSGNGAGLLESDQTGHYVEYTVPVPAQGTYRLKAGIKTSPDQGTFQLSIDGANQGSPQDQYSPEAGYGVRDLGPVTFTSAGDKSFQFLVTGRNPASGGYDLVFDYLDLVPHFEAEALVIKAHTAPSKRIHDPSLSGRAGTLVKTTRVGNYLTYTVPVATAGIYNVQVKTKENGNADKFRLWIDGEKQGYPQKQDSGSSNGDGAFDLGSVFFRSAGEKSFQFLVKESEPNNTGAHFILDYVDLVLATQLEAEDLAADPSAQFARVTDAHMSKRAGILLNAKAAGESVAFKVTAPVAGTYGVKLGVRTGDKSGIVQLAIDGVNQGPAQDGYSAKVSHRVLDLGRVTFPESGGKIFQFVVTGQNPSSSGYQFLLDYIDLVR